MKAFIVFFVLIISASSFAAIQECNGTATEHKGKKLGYVDLKYDAGWQSFSGKIGQFEMVAHKKDSMGFEKLTIEDTATGVVAHSESLEIKTVEEGELKRVELHTPTHDVVLVCSTKSAR